MPAPEFDQFAADYAAALGRGLALTGEPAEFFARRRALWLRRCLEQRGTQTGTVLDFGCGTGQGTSILRSVLAPDSTTSRPPTDPARCATSATACDPADCWRSGRTTPGTQARDSS